MKKQIRKSVFETNSSSVHAMAILNEQEYERYQRGALKLHPYYGLVEANDYEDPEIYLEKDITSKDIDGKRYYAVAVYGYDG